MRTIIFLLLCTIFCSSYSQNPPDSITRRPALRGMFRWIVSPELYEEGNILNNLKTGEWNKYYKDKLSGKTVYENGLAVAEYWMYDDTLKARYVLAPGRDSLQIHDYDVAGKLKTIKKFTIDPKTIFLNYSLMTEDTLFKKTLVTEITYEYELWTHRNDMVIVTEKTGGIPNKKYYSLADGKWNLLWEMNDKGDFISGKKKDFQKEEEKSRKKLEADKKKGDK
jgi:hypothetical protein